jgi:hypothetical protein
MIRRKERSGRVASRVEREREAAKGVPDFTRRTDRIARAEQIRELRAERKKRWEERGLMIDGELTLTGKPPAEAAAPAEPRPAPAEAAPRRKPRVPTLPQHRSEPKASAKRDRPKAPAVKSPLIRRAKSFQDDEQ